MTQQVKTLVAKLNGLSLILWGFHGGRSELIPSSFPLAYTCAVHTQPINQSMKKYIIDASF